MYVYIYTLYTCIYTHTYISRYIRGYVHVFYGSPASSSDSPEREMTIADVRIHIYMGDMSTGLQELGFAMYVNSGLSVFVVQ